MSAHAPQESTADEATANPLAEYDDLPRPSDDPDLAYCYPGKQYRVFGRDLTFSIVEYRPDAVPQLDGVVIIEANDGERILDECERTDAGVDRDLLAAHSPDRADRAAYTVTGLLASLARLEIGEVEPGSYADHYWAMVDAGEGA